MNELIEIDFEKKQARVQPGCVLDDLRDAAEKRQMTFGPDPATHNHNTLGGMIGNNSCGMHAQMAGKTERNIDELEILTYDGATHARRADERRRTRGDHRAGRSKRRDLHEIA